MSTENLTLIIIGQSALIALLIATAIYMIVQSNHLANEVEILKGEVDDLNNYNEEQTRLEKSLPNL